MAALSSHSWGADSGDNVYGVIRILFIMFKPFKISNILPSRLTRSSVKNSKLDYLNESELKMFSKGVESCTFMYDAKLKGFSELTADILQGAKGKYRQQDSFVTDSLDTIYRLVKQVQRERFFL